MIIFIFILITYDKCRIVNQLGVAFDEFEEHLNMS